MKKWVYVTLVIVLTLLVFSVWKTKKRRNPNVGDSIGRLTASAHGEKNNTKKDKAEQEKNVPARKKIYKPISLEVGQGSATIVEIDHGLPEQRNDTKEMRRGVDYGLLGAITLRVVDSQGTPVQGATLFGGFWNNNKNDPPATGTSDANGEIALMRNCAGDFNFSITKDGYYTTRLRYWFFKNGYDCAKDGRWLPWNPTVEIPLKDIRNPIPLYMKTIEKNFPKGTTVGFDCLTGDFIAPWGTGAHADFSVQYESIRPSVLPGMKYPDFSCFTNSQTLTATDGGGFITKSKDTYSQMLSEYEAPRNGYSDTIAYEMKRTHDKIFVNAKLNDDQYLFLRSCAKRNGMEAPDNAYHGKIYQLGFGESLTQTNTAQMRMYYYFNSTPGDRNLEATGYSP